MVALSAPVQLDDGIEVKMARHSRANGGLQLHFAQYAFTVVERDGVWLVTEKKVLGISQASPGTI